MPCPAGPPCWFCNIVCFPLQISIKADFKRTEWHADIAIDQQGLESDAVVTVVCLYLGCSGLFFFCWAVNPGWLWKIAFEVICGWSVAGAVFNDVISTARCSRSVSRLLVANIHQLDQLTSRTSRHLTRRPHTNTVEPWGRDVHNFCVWIIRNCCLNYWKLKKNISISAKNHVWIIREVELLERIW